MENMSSQALRMAVINAAAAEVEFREALVKDGAEAVTARFGDQGLKVLVHLETEGEMPVLIPQRTDRLASAVKRIADDLGRRTPTRGEFEATVLHRAWTEPAFLAQLRKDPQAAIDSMLKTHGASVPANVEVHTYEESPGECLIVVSPPRADDAELSEEELKAVAGGAPAAIVSVTSHGVSGSIASKVLDNVWTAAPSRWSRR